MEIITSKANNLVKKVKKLHQKKYRLEAYLIEGWHLFEEAVASGADIQHIFVLPAYFARVATFSQAVAVSPEILKELSDSLSPQGIVAVVSLPDLALPERFVGKWLLLEDVQDPGNVGTLIRTADAAGFTGVLITDKTADIFNLKTLRAMQGSHFHLPVYRGQTAELLAQLAHGQVQIIATTLTAQSVDYRTLHVSDNFVLVVGNEGQGISSEMVAHATVLTHIPMPGQAESLNVAVAAGILMFSLI